MAKGVWQLQREPEFLPTAAQKSLNLLEKREPYWKPLGLEES